MDKGSVRQRLEYVEQQVRSKVKQFQRDNQEKIQVDLEKEMNLFIIIIIAAHFSMIKFRLII